MLSPGATGNRCQQICLVPNKQNLPGLEKFHYTKKKSKKCHILLHMYFYRNRVLICNLKIIGQKISWQSYVADKNRHVCLVMFAYTKDSGYRETPLPLHPFSSLSYVFFILETGKYKRIMGSIWKHFYFKIFLNACNNQFLLRISYLLVSQAYHLREHLHSNNMKKILAAD